MRWYRTAINLLNLVLSNFGSFYLKDFPMLGQVKKALNENLIIISGSVAVLPSVSMKKFSVHILDGKTHGPYLDPLLEELLRELRLLRDFFLRPRLRDSEELKRWGQGWVRLRSKSECHGHGQPLLRSLGRKS